MRITIAQRLRPFSHTPGACCLLPGSFIKVQAFPTRLVFSDLSSPEPVVLKTFDFALTGPVEDFTVQQDLEKGNVLVWGHYREGFVRYCITAGADSKSYQLTMERAPEAGVSFTGLPAPLRAKESFSSQEGISLYIPQDMERLSFGCHKAQDWDRVHRAASPEEIYPFIYRLGRIIPQHAAQKSGGVPSLIEKAQNADRMYLHAILQQFYRAGFEGILSPKFEDTQFQGFNLPTMPKDFTGSPLSILTEGSKMIRDLLIQGNGMQLSLLPKLPPQLHAGRLLNAEIQGLGTIDFEWSKKSLKKLIIHTSHTTTLQLTVSKSLKSFRLRKSKKDRGVRIEVGQSIEISSGITYYLDNFEK